MWQLFIVTFFEWWEIQFDQVWSSLIHFWQIWSKKIKNKTVVSILSVNVTTFYCNILRLVRKSNLINFDQLWSTLDRSDPKESKINSQCYPFCKCGNLVRNPIWSSLIKFDPFWTDLIQIFFYPFCKCDNFLFSSG